MKRILIIDDDDQFRRMLSTMIEKEGYEVNDAPDGEIGVRLQEEKSFDTLNSSSNNKSMSRSVTASILFTSSILSPEI